MLVVKMSLLILWDYFQSKQLPQKAENGHPPISLYLIETLCPRRVFCEGKCTFLVLLPQTWMQKHRV